MQTDLELALAGVLWNKQKVREHRRSSGAFLYYDLSATNHIIRFI